MMPREEEPVNLWLEDERKSGLVINLERLEDPGGAALFLESRLCLSS